MKKFFLIIGTCLITAMTCLAQEPQKFDGIDHVTISQDINLDTCKVYIVPTVLAEKKGSKKSAEQDVAFAELGPTLAKELKATFRHGSFEVISDIKDAPAGAVVIEACLKEIEWGNALARQATMGAGGRMAGSYSAKMSNGKGLILEYDTRRSHSTVMTSAMGPDIIRLYNRVIAQDLLNILNRHEHTKEQEIRGIDYVAVAQKVNLANRKVCISPVVLADFKPKKDLEEQQKAFDELGQTVIDVLKSEYKTATFELIDDAGNAPADAIVIEAILKDIDWGVATMTDQIFGASDVMSGSYQVIIRNAQGKMLEFKNRRIHKTSMSSSKAPNLIRVYNKALAKDIVAVINNIK